MLKLVKSIRISIVVSSLLIISLLMSLTSCKGLPYKEEDVLCEYPDFNCLYYVKNEYKEYKYSDYIIDDVSNGQYKEATPNIVDFKNGSGMFDYDIGAYVEARTDFMLKKEIIGKYEISVADICAKIRDDYFVERNALVHFYDKENKKDTLLNDSYVTNISYDDEIPVIWFDAYDESSTELEIEEITEGRKMLLSDIIAANSTIDGFMRVMLSKNKTRYQYFMDRLAENDENTVATSSETT